MTSKPCQQEPTVERCAGLRKHPLYYTHHSLVARCTNPEKDSYPRYGGRGITVEPYLLQLANFIAYIEAELGPKPGSDYTLDRVDNNKGYIRGNLRWASPKTQTRNRRNTLLVDYQGETCLLLDVAAIVGLSYNTVTSRIRRGWSVEKAITTAAKRHCRKVAGGI